MSDAIEWLLIIVPALWYAAGVRALWRRAGVGRGVSRAQVAAFAGAVATLVIAFSPPLDSLADDLFSAHMVQHLLLIIVAAPLCVMGAPLLPMLSAFTPGRRRTLGALWHRHEWLRAISHAVTRPGVAFLLHLVAIWFWHFPRPYQAAVRHEGIHVIEHFSFFATALLLWWVVLEPLGRRAAHAGAGLLVIAGTLMQSGALGAVLMFASAPWYPVHAAGVLAHGMTLTGDQQLAGLLMWIPASAVYIAAAAWLFVQWMRADARRTEAGEGRRASSMAPASAERAIAGGAR